MYSSTQASLAPDVVSHQIFVRGNCDKLGYILPDEGVSQDGSDVEVSDVEEDESIMQ